MFNLFYYQKDHENVESEQKVQNFEPPIHYVVEQKVAIQGIKMSKGIESILITKQEIVVVPIAEPTIAQGVSMVVKVRYNEPKLNQQSGNIIKGISRD